MYLYIYMVKTYKILKINKSSIFIFFFFKTKTEIIKLKKLVFTKLKTVILVYKIVNQNDGVTNIY